MNEIMKYILAGLGGIMLAWIGSKITHLLDNTVKVSSPTARAIEQLVPTVNMMSTSYGAVLNGIKTLLEVQKGQCNGNVDRALEDVTEAKEIYDNHVLTRLAVREEK